MSAAASASAASFTPRMLVLLAAMRLGRPVKWIEDRREHLMCANQGREQRHLVRIACDKNGIILGIQDEIFHDQGAYSAPTASTCPTARCSMLTGRYKVPAYRAMARFRLTNKTPAATYRAPGRFESTFVRGRIIDAMADQLGIDRIEVRRRNLIASSEMPYTFAFNEPGIETLLIDSGDYALLLDKSLKAFGWDKLQAELKRRRAKGERVGAGVALFLEESGKGPSDGARISVDTTGNVELITGGASLGQGFEPHGADRLRSDRRRLSHVRVIHGQTDLIDHGIGAHAARATGLTGGAVHVTAMILRAKALEFASELLQTPADDLDIVDGSRRAPRPQGGPRSRSRTSPSASRRVRNSCRTRSSARRHGWYNTDNTVFPYGIHLAVVRIDGDTGHVAVERFMVAYDVGRAVNPLLVAVARWRLRAGARRRALGGIRLRQQRRADGGDLADYLMPTLRDVPDVEILLTEDAPSPFHPLGLKGAGEGGINGAGGVIATAIDDALGMPGAVTQLPMTPQRIRELLRRRPPTRAHWSEPAFLPSLVAPQHGTEQIIEDESCVC